MRQFENHVKELKFKVLRSIAKAMYEQSDMAEVVLNTPKEIIPGPKATMRCCIYKERAIVEERILMGLGGHKQNTNILEAIPIACDECPLGGFEVTDHCRGCISKNCMHACRRGAIKINEVTHKAFIDKEKCVNCGLCASVCNYNAIMNFVRPCEKACIMHAIEKGETGEAVINDSKCIGCGQCVYKCPFGAIIDKSYIRDAINLINNKENHVYAIIAPAVMSSFRDCSFKQLVTSIKKLGFYDVVETAYGADLVAKLEAKELLEKGKITTSCCPSFVSYIKKAMPEYSNLISSTLSPMATLAEFIKSQDSTAKVVFIGPCTSKKYEIKTKHVGGRVDITLTFEELDAMFAAKEVEPSTEIESEYNFIASKSGRGFASAGGVLAALTEEVAKLDPNFVVKPMNVSGITNFKQAIVKFASSDEFNVLEGMACEGGCLNGPCALNHDRLNERFLEKYKNS